MAAPCVTLPCVTLSYSTYEAYATYEASSYDSDNSIYIFKNIRFAAAPTGDLRWQAPQPPLTQPGVQNGSVGGTCCQPLNFDENQSDHVWVSATTSADERSETGTMQRHRRCQTGWNALMVVRIAPSQRWPSISDKWGLPFPGRLRSKNRYDYNLITPCPLLDLWRRL